MPTFDTPEPIAVSLSVVAADVRIVAADRTDTVVEVRAANNSTRSARLVEQTRVEYADGRLLVKTPKHLGTLFGRTGSIDVEIHLPAGSTLDGDTGLGDLHADGRLGDCRFSSGYGRLHFAQTANLRASTGAGEISAEQVLGDAELSTGAGRTRVGHIAGNAVIKSSTGGCEVGTITGTGRINGADGPIVVGRAAAELTAKTANGDVRVDRAEAGLTAKTAFGDIRVGAAVRGTHVLETSAGRIDVGIPEGTAAWLDLRSTSTVRNSLDTVPGPEEADERVEVRARTSWGDITIHRA
ncbi:hypothetical protein Cme02nite_70440 [Catellatospora methionotrophica]|uniref:DUF4097 domain-containing protein n=1 Tax=Catellatospora methionotrophica TaxID=121620 RepID=A0A8J3LG51_9ACTN|nr:DUF4097 family beta strand repeat-containing protein [Catellatospora methionotrophica]GIG18712.1 hypothetical protein Cme02nite_70440 [Catellatospora methionotrophica]